MIKGLLFFCAVLLLGSCAKDKLASITLNSPFENTSEEFLIVDSIYCPSNFNQPQYVKFLFHDYLRDTSFYDHINVYFGPILYQQLSRKQKSMFEFNYSFPYPDTYVITFTLVGFDGDESRRSKDYEIVVY